jgi:hypothetical protein
VPIAWSDSTELDVDSGQCGDFVTGFLPHKAFWQKTCTAIVAGFKPAADQELVMSIDFCQDI